MKQKGVYVLVGIPYSYAEELRAREPLEKAMSKLIRSHRAAGTDYQATKEYADFKQAWKGIPKDHSIPCSKGFFPTLQDAVNILEKYPDSIHEGGYYSMYVIEFRPYGFDNIPFGGNETEVWFKMHETKSGIKYKKIKKPKFFQHLVGFSS